MTKRILVTGACGLVGTDLVERLRNDFGKENIFASDIAGESTNSDVFYKTIDVRDKQKIEKFIVKNKISVVYHLAGLLSVGGEDNPNLAWEVNVNGLKNILDLANKYRVQVFWPSSIAVFGPNTPKINTPQHTILEPTTIYGVTKVAGELLCQYYYLRYGVDIRSLRYPGLIAWRAAPGNGTTEYSVHIFHAALKQNHYTCFLKEDSTLPMMYINDAISGTIKLMQTESKKITIRTSYNFSALSFSPRELADEISKQHKGFACDYKPDERQAIADSWPKSIDDSAATRDWGWKPKFDLKKLVAEMLTNLSYDKNKLL